MSVRFNVFWRPPRSVVCNRPHLDRTSGFGHAWPVRFPVAEVCFSALCRALHKADYVGFSLMHSSRMGGPPAPSEDQAADRISPLHNFSALRIAIDGPSAR